MTSGRDIVPEQPMAQPNRDAGFTLIELLIVVGIIAVITAIAAAGLMRTKAAANEASAISSIRITSSGQKAYAIACGRGAYASSYLVLGAAPPGGGGGFVSEELGGAMNPMKSGYRFSTTAGAGSSAGPTDCNANPTITAYYATAVPLSLVSGGRSFAVNVTGTIWQIKGGTAPTEPFSAPAVPVQ